MPNICPECGHDMDDHEMNAGNGKPYVPDITWECMVDDCDCELDGY